MRAAVVTAERDAMYCTQSFPLDTSISHTQGLLTSMRLSSLMALTLVSTWLDDKSSRATKKFPPGGVPGAGSSSNKDGQRRALTWTKPSTPTDG